MPRPVFTEERCKGCALCTKACPKKIIGISTRFNSKGYQPATCTDESKCIGCSLCAKTCPDIVIEIHK
ncbi:4Fe-4S dicluster domain-containing protein [Anaerospora hongkongensis]|uniref:4Fe-4S dicluster domain-containing protein n=1 Tax=Anaerospora hongkongensis TaxID=244830 RepID=UPI0028A2CFEA|nr:4Fe-4S dicluster domain-containing protein [Anaerospora hongkongensis]